ncbi:MATE family efflux transporter [Luteolibacter sp. GHJ8]|uniref:MATE family efflux transporter n=1 Tax=Luteolibacter rhizosphaerae TaxID=2989719 RepID=A0ABT3G9A7_9BACT|nr:MATE family efflux transporter [Luteolibacter rhizosphaerae]MCW1916431.1 MATE family efflux transporter [Luteolibacter rhizosphaerae]
MPENESTSVVTHGPLLRTFLRFVIPSALSLTAISTTSFVDSVIVGRFVGADALAAVSLLIPYISFLFGIALMFAVGGAVRVANCLGARDDKEASEIFSLTLAAVVLLSASAALLGNLFSGPLFRLLGADQGLAALMGQYFPVLSVAMIVQLGTLVLYYFVRADDRPGLGTKALLTGALTNILIDYLLVAHLRMGLQGSAWGTLLAQLVQLAVLSSYFRHPQRHLSLHVVRAGWNRLFRTAGNGASEFVNEFSVGAVIFTMNFLLMRRYGTDGVAAWGILNAFIFISLMVYYGVVDAMHVLFGRNMGAGRWDRVRGFLGLAAAFVGTLAISVTLLLVIGGDRAIGIFLSAEGAGAERLAHEFVRWMWPLFLVSGFNVLICSYLTSREKASLSATIALLRTLLLPIGFGVALSFFMPDTPVVTAFAVAEWVTFAVALVFLWRHRPLAEETAPSLCLDDLTAGSHD